MKNTHSKIHPYEVLHGLNHGFEQVLSDLARLAELGVRRQLVRQLNAAVEESRAWANVEVLEPLLESEKADWSRHGQLRLREEKQRRVASRKTASQAMRKRRRS